ncbi:MAG TPA: aminotransferase class V-fold PLP-dependent enzyme, partial [Thermodesulfobacteriota bacterium]|nr:aminotransferase class V-fold PLP-dependent enzyme [Thermodesulfobacteriota bacterium]
MAGRHFLQIPGPTNTPDRILRALARPVIDHRGPEFARLVRGLLADLRRVFKTERGEILVFPGSGTGAWESALVNTLSPGDRVLAFETGHFARLWAEMALRFGLEVETIPLDWGEGIPAEVAYRTLAADTRHTYRAVLAVHNETSTGVTSDIAALRRAIDRARHPALLLVDVVSSLASIDFRMDEWGVDVAVTGSQKGLMLPPGLAIVAAGPRALEAAARARSRRSFYDWQAVLEQSRHGFFPYTPATNLLYGLREALDMLFEEGLEAVFARHARLADAVRAAVRAWGLELLCRNPAEYSNTLTAVKLPPGYDADRLLALVLERHNLSLGVGLSKVKGTVFRIGHLGWLGELEVLATLAGVEMGLRALGLDVPLGSGVRAAQERFLAHHAAAEAGGR